MRKIQRTAPTYTNKTQLYRLVDALPSGPDWICKEITQIGDCVDANGNQLTESLDFPWSVLLEPEYVCRFDVYMLHQLD